jgi:hypothetical protein
MEELMASPTAAEFVAQAEHEIGVPYSYGGDSPSGFDCSGLVMWCLQQIGITDCPRTSEEQWWNWCERLGGQSDLLAGDLIFEQWPQDTDPSPGHVVIYVGGGNVVEAPQPGQDVWKRPWSPSETTIVGYGRIPGLVMSPVPVTAEDLDMSTQSSNGTASISFRTGSVSTLQVTTDSPPLELRVVLSLNTGPWVQNGTGGTGVNASLYTLSNGFATYTLDGSHVASCGGVTLEAQGAGSTGKIFSVTGF